MEEAILWGGLLCFLFSKKVCVFTLSAGDEPKLLVFIALCHLNNNKLITLLIVAIYIWDKRPVHTVPPMRIGCTFVAFTLHMCRFQTGLDPNSSQPTSGGGFNPDLSESSIFITS